MKSLLIPTARLLLPFALTGLASAQLKTGSNPETITSTANFEVEASSGSKTVIDKTTGNVGIGLTTPSSTLSVAGSLATNYTSVNATTYTVLATDSVIAWNGTATGTITLPAAVSGSGNFKGRTYTIKNTSGAYTVAVAASGSETIDSASTYLISPGASATFVSTGATSGTSWTAVGQSSTAGTSFSGGYVSGVDLTGLPSATINVTLVSSGTATVTASQVTTAMNSLPSSGGVIVIKIVNSATYTSATHGTTMLSIATPTNVPGRTFYLLLDFSTVDVNVDGAYQHPIYLVATSRLYGYSGGYVAPGSTSVILNPQQTPPAFSLKSSPILMFRGTSSDYWLVETVGGIAY